MKYMNRDKAPDLTRKPKLSILELKPISWGEGTEKTSEEIDKIVYDGF